MRTVLKVLLQRNAFKMLLYALPLTFGVATFISLDSFKYSITANINDEAKELVGADVQIRSYQDYADSTMNLIKAFGDTIAEEKFFSSMIMTADSSSRLAQIHATEREYPFYGAIETDPPSAAHTFHEGNRTLVDVALLEQYDLSIGDSIRVGKVWFVIEGKLLKVPRQASVASIFAPAIYIPYDKVDATGLIQFGSRVVHYAYIKSNREDFDIAYEKLRTDLEEQNIQSDSFKTRSANFGKIFTQFGAYLNLVSFIAFLLGSLGIASSISLFFRTSRRQVALLKCLGVKNRSLSQGISLTLVIIAGIGFLIGALFSFFMVDALPNLFADFLPIDVDTSLDSISVLKGIAMCIIFTFLFAFPSLISLLKAEAKDALSSEQQLNSRIPVTYFLFVIVIIYAFTWIQTSSALSALIFLAGLIVISLFILALYRVFVWGLGALRFQNFILKQSIRNLMKNTQKNLLLSYSLTLSMVLILTITLTKNILVDQLRIEDAPNRPNVILFDIKKAQETAIQEAIDLQHGTVLETSPIISIRLKAINGVPRHELKELEDSEIPDHVLDREYRVTFRPDLKESEQVIAGEWVSSVSNGDEPVVSLAENLAKDMQVKVGDYVTFNIQGLTLKCRIANIREVKWNSFNTNFTIVFPLGVIDDAPQSTAITAKIANEDRNVLQRKLLSDFPNVSLLNLDRVINSVQGILDKIVIAMEVLAGVSLVTALIILITSLINSLDMRRREISLIGILGATPGKVVSSYLTEFILLGTTSVLVSLIIANLITMTLSQFVLESPFTWHFQSQIGIALMALTIIMLAVFFTMAQLIRTPMNKILKEGE